MSTTPVPDDPIAGSAAVPSAAAPDDAVAAGDEALPQQAVRPETATADQLCIAGDDMPDPAHYCQQIFSIPSRGVVKVSSWQEMMAEIFKYGRIDTLVILSHGSPTGAVVEISKVQRTLSQLAGGMGSDVSTDPFPGLETWPGTIGTLHLEGCSVGSDPLALLQFKRRVPVSSVEAWSMGRYLDLYTVKVTGNAAAVVQEFKDRGDFVRAEPYLPKGPHGGTYVARDLEAALLNAKQFAIFADIYGDSFSFALEPFGELVAMPDPPFVQGVHFTRADGLRNATVVKTEADAADLRALIDASRPVLHKVIAR